ncbi:MAG: hypothetical protein QNJ94_20555 [Alphaproteobacteria bacterium]|nr:hypothetical protein [Alphaproteobacteria bacterium]
MGIFIFSAISGYLIGAGVVIALAIPSKLSQPEQRKLTLAVVQIAIGVAIALMVFFAEFADVYHLSKPKTVQMTVGGLFGFIVRLVVYGFRGFPTMISSPSNVDAQDTRQNSKPKKAGKSSSSKKAKSHRPNGPAGNSKGQDADGQNTPWVVENIKLISVALLGLALFALLGPYAATLSRHMTRISTPWLEAQFTPLKTAQQIVLRGTASTISPPNLSQVEEYKEVLKRDIELAEMLKGVPHKRWKDSLPGTKRFIETLLVPLAACAELAGQDTRDPDAIRAVLRPVTHQIRRLTLEVRMSDGAGNSDRQEALRQMQDGVALQIKEAGKKVAAFVVPPSPGSAPSMRDVCVEREDIYFKTWPVDVPDIGVLVENPGFHIIVSFFYAALRNYDGAIEILRENEKKFSKSPNYSYLLGQLMQLNGRPALEYLPYYRQALQSISAVGNAISVEYPKEASKLPECIQETAGEEKTKSPPADARRINRIKQRVFAGKLHLKQELAYHSAVGLAETPAPEKFADWFRRARYYANDIRDAIQDKDFTKRLCLDTESYLLVKAKIQDTYSIVQLVAAAKSEPVELSPIEGALTNFENALNTLDSIGKTNLETNSKLAAQHKSLVETITYHRRQAELLLGGR